MQLLQELQQNGGIDAMARDLGVSKGTALQGAEALLPAVLGGFKQSGQSAGGLGGLLGMIGGLGGGGLLDTVLGSQPTDVGTGNQVLGNIFGSKDVSRNVAGHVAQKTGLSGDLLKKMLPILAMLVAGYFAKHHGAAAPAAPASGSMGGGFGGLGKMLDMDGDGNPLNDLIGMAGKLGR
ncbi:DUF937 domain-containing protein [Novosphingopyxis sp.]|uniref:DUF937 domain-containing protein n=1 Tax=Novosphingopyxis sp. TaxID=2709690 RepID=UPI003B5BB3B4